MLLLVSVIRHHNSIISYSAISVPLLRRDFLIKASEIYFKRKKRRKSDFTTEITEALRYTEEEEQEKN
ncbi:MAG: hypothetical protein ACI9OH_002180 [Oleispira sp.]|jgi:hypothetical protein